MNRYYRFFPLIIVYSLADVRNVPIENDKDQYSKSMKKFSKDNLSFYIKTLNNRKVVVHPQVVTLNHPKLPCLNLGIGNLCNIYSFKPKACTLYPYRIDTPISHMDKGLAREKQRSFEMSEYIPCGGWEDTNEVIYTSKGPSEDGIYQLFKERTNEISNSTELLKDYFKDLKENKDIESKIESYSSLNDNNDNVIQVKFVDFILWLINKNIISDLLAVNVLRGQKEVLEKLMNTIDFSSNKEYELIHSVAKSNIDSINNYINKVKE